MFFASFSMISPSALRTTTAYDAGPGLPREAPSIFATCTPAGGFFVVASGKRRALEGGETLRIMACGVRSRSSGGDGVGGSVGRVVQDAGAGLAVEKLGGV